MVQTGKTQLVTASTSKALSLDEVKDWLRLPRGYTREDDLLNVARNAAISRCEEYLGRKLLTQTWNAYYDYFPAYGEIKLPFGPVQGLVSDTTSVIYYDSSGSKNTYSSTNYSVDTVSDPGGIVLSYGATWPTDTLRPMNPIQIEFITGYGDESSDIPANIVNGMKRYVGDLHEHREDSLIGQGVTVVEIPYGVQDMWRPFKQNYGAF